MCDYKYLLYKQLYRISGAVGQRRFRYGLHLGVESASDNMELDVQVM